MEQQKSSKKLIVVSNFANKECNELIQIAANSEKKIEILEEKKKYFSDKLTEALSVKTYYFTPLRQLSYNADISALQEKINALKNYEELQNKFKKLTDDNKKLKFTKVQNSEIINELKNKLYVQNKPIFFSKSKDDKLQEKNNLFEKHIRKFFEILNKENKETVHTGLSIDRKTKKSGANVRIEFKLKEILNNFQKERLEKDQDDAWLMRVTKFSHKKKSELIQIATNYEEKLDLLEKEIKYVVDTLRKVIEAKINTDLEKEIDLESKKIQLEVQIKELENNSDLKILQTILNELTLENINLRTLNHKNSSDIKNLRKQINFSRSKEKRNADAD